MDFPFLNFVSQIDLFSIFIQYLTNTELLELRKVSGILWRRMVYNGSFWERLLKQIKPNHVQGTILTVNMQAACLRERLKTTLGLIHQDVRKNVNWNAQELLFKSVEKNLPELFLQVQFKRSSFCLSEQLWLMLRKFNRTQFFGLFWLHLDVNKRKQIWYGLSAVSLINIPWGTEQQQLSNFKSRKLTLTNKALKEAIFWSVRWKLVLLLDHIHKQTITYEKQRETKIITLIALLQNGYYSMFEKELSSSQKLIPRLFYDFLITIKCQKKSAAYLIKNYLPDIFRVSQEPTAQLVDVLKMLTSLIKYEVSEPISHFILDLLVEVPSQMKRDNYQFAIAYALVNIPVIVQQKWLKEFLVKYTLLNEVFFDFYIRYSDFTIKQLEKLKPNVSPILQEIVQNYIFVKTHRLIW